MQQIFIDGQAVQADEGMTILEAAQRAGVKIPTLCWLKGYRPQTSCMVCVVELEPSGKIVPACAYPVSEGLRVRSQADEVIKIRKRNLALLLSEHLGDCVGPCVSACPAGMNIPQMIRHIEKGQLEEAIATIKRDIPLPGVLGRICPAPCEGICRRKYQDEAVAICQLKRYAADWDLAREMSYLGEAAVETGKRVAIVGAGTAGLSAGWFLRMMGHRCVIYEREHKAGGKLHEIEPERLGEDIIRKEADLVAKVGVEIRYGQTAGAEVSLDELRQGYDAVLICAGENGLKALGGGELEAVTETMATGFEGVFAAGNAVRKGRVAIRSIGQAKMAACSIDHYLAGKEVKGWQKRFSCHIGKVIEGEIEAMTAYSSGAGRVLPKADKLTALSTEQAEKEAGRCLHCDCNRAEDCRLRNTCEFYEMDAGKLSAERDRYELVMQAPKDRNEIGGKAYKRVGYEKGKCIRCGLCVQITEHYQELYGLSFVGRGYEAFVTVPLGHSLNEALGASAQACVEACPTGALSFR